MVPGRSDDAPGHLVLTSQSLDPRARRGNYPEEYYARELAEKMAEVALPIREGKIDFSYRMNLIRELEVRGSSELSAEAMRAMLGAHFGHEIVLQRERTRR